MQLLKSIFFIFLVCSCELHRLETPGNIVPATADQDSLLPQLKIDVAGKLRSIHLQTFGDIQSPPLFVIHGGPGADFKLMLPLQSLSEKYFVVMWDLRGAGLSERVGKDELKLESFLEEISEVYSKLSLNQPVTIIAHSFGGLLSIKFAIQNPQQVQQLILIEPGGFTSKAADESKGGAISFMDGHDFFWQNELLSSANNASADYKAISLLPKSSRNWTCDNSIIENYPLWRFGALHYYYVMQNVWKEKPNWVNGIENYKKTIVVIAGSCGALSYNYQEKHNIQYLSDYKLVIVDGANHISLFTEFQESLLVKLKDELDFYQ